MSVFVLDIDGTICFDRCTIGAPMLDVLRAIADAHDLVLASARHPADIVSLIPPDIQNRVDIVGCNGAVALRHGALSSSVKMNMEGVRRALEALDAIGCPYMAYGTDFVLMSSAPHAWQSTTGAGLRRICPHEIDDGDDFVKILILADRNPSPEVLRIARIPGTTAHVHDDGSVDLTADGVDKVHALKALGHALPIYAGFGNDLNDAGFLAESSVAVRVGSHPGLATVTHHSVSDEQGAVEKLQELLRRATEE